MVHRASRGAGRALTSTQALRGAPASGLTGFTRPRQSSNRTTGCRAKPFDPVLGQDGLALPSGADALRIAKRVSAVKTRENSGRVRQITRNIYLTL
jgi:hypothetical protein